MNTPHKASAPRTAPASTYMEGFWQRLAAFNKRHEEEGRPGCHGWQGTPTPEEAAACELERAMGAAIRAYCDATITRLFAERDAAQSSGQA